MTDQPPKQPNNLQKISIFIKNFKNDIKISNNCARDTRSKLSDKHEKLEFHKKVILVVNMLRGFFCIKPNEIDIWKLKVK